MVTAIPIRLDVNVGLDELSLMRQVKLQVLDGEPTTEPLLLIVGLDFKDVIGQSAMVKVIGVNFDRKSVHAN